MIGDVATIGGPAAPTPELGVARARIPPSSRRKAEECGCSADCRLWLATTVSCSRPKRNAASLRAPEAHAARRNASTRRNQQFSWFQLAKLRLTNLNPT
jgi:hypothetical protein